MPGMSSTDQGRGTGRKSLSGSVCGFGAAAQESGLSGQRPDESKWIRCHVRKSSLWRACQEGLEALSVVQDAYRQVDSDCAYTAVRS